MATLGAYAAMAAGFHDDLDRLLPLPVVPLATLVRGVPLLAAADRLGAVRQNTRPSPAKPSTDRRYAVMGASCRSMNDILVKGNKQVS